MLSKVKNKVVRRLLSVGAALLQGAVAYYIYYSIQSGMGSVGDAVIRGTGAASQLKYLFYAGGAVLSVLVYAAIYALFSKSFFREMGIRPPGLCAAGAMVTLGACAQVTVTLVLPILFVLFPAFNTMPESADVSSFAGGGFPFSAFVYYTMVTGIMEEVLFRGIIHKRLRGVLSPLWATALSALLFGAAHQNAAQFSYTLLLGIILAAVYERYETVAAPAILHAAFNATTFFIATKKIYSIPLYAAILTVSIMLFTITTILIFSKKKKQKPDTAGERTPNETV